MSKIKVAGGKQPLYPALNGYEKNFIDYVVQNRDIGYGRMMQMISGLWYDLAGDGAHCVSDTFGGVRRKKSRCRRLGHDWEPGSSLLWCCRCGANKSKPQKELVAICTRCKKTASACECSFSSDQAAYKATKYLRMTPKEASEKRT